MRALIVIDNVETFPEPERVRLYQFLSRLPPACKAIVTSRRRADIDARVVRLDRLERKDALDLMAELALDREDWAATEALARKALDLSEKVRRQELIGADCQRWPGRAGRKRACPTLAARSRFSPVCASRATWKKHKPRSKSAEGEPYLENVPLMRVLRGRMAVRETTRSFDPI